MHTINNPPSRKFYIARTGSDVVHYGFVDPGQRLETPQDDLTIFDSESAYVASLAALGIVLDDALPVIGTGSLELDRTLMCAHVNRLRAAKLSCDITYMGHPFESDAESLNNLTGMIASIGAGLQLPPDFAWMAADNVAVSMNKQQLMGLAGTMLAYRNKCYQVSWAHKNAIRSSSDPVSLNVETGWPDPTNPTA